MDEKNVLELVDVRKSFKKKEVIKGISFSIENGDILSIMGPNGVGKTTLLRIISGLYEPSSGIVNRLNVSENEAYCSVLFEQNGLYPTFTLRENLRFFQNIRNKKDLALSDEALYIVKKLQMEEKLDERIRFFSKGMLRKVALARAILKNPRLLILDEPFDGLDVESHSFLIRFLRDWVKEGKRSIVVSSHNVLEIERLCNRVVLLRDGRVIKNTTLEELKKEAYKGYEVTFGKNESDDIINRTLQDMNIKYNKKENGAFELDVPENRVGEIISKLKEREIEIREAKFIETDLEEIYLKCYEVNQ